MRKPITIISNATAPAPLLPPPPPPPPLLTSSNSSAHNDIYRNGTFFFPPIPFLDSASDIASLILMSGLLLLSLISLSFISLLRLKSRRSHHLKNFNSVWTIRFVLVSLITLWAQNEFFRLHLFRQRYLYPILPPLTLSQHANLCKTHIVLSLGFFEPGFLVTFLFLVDISIKRRSPDDLWAIASIILSCLPIFWLQTLFVVFSPSEVELPDIFRRAFVLSTDDFGNKTVLCTYPLLNTIVFGAFGIVFTLVFLLSCRRVVSLVINKGIRIRIHILAIAVVTLLQLQILFLGLSAWWRPEKPANGGVMFAMCLSVTLCAAVGESILVIKPIIEALTAGGYCSRWSAALQLQLQSEG